MPYNSAQGLAADIAASVSGGAAAVSWIATANDALQLVATAIAIVAGVYAIKWHRIRIQNEKRKSNESEREGS